MKIIVDNLATEYMEDGSGPVALILHGWGSSADVFKDLIDGLKSSHRVVALNLPGFGGSEQPKSDWGISDYAMFVAAFCKKINMVPEAIIGHSLGGQIAVNAVGNEILQPTKLILISAAALRPKLGLKKQGIQLGAKIGKSILGNSTIGQKARKKLYESIGSSEYLDSPAMQAIYRKVITQDQTQSAQRIDCPALLIWGDNDRDTPLSEGKALNKLIHKSQLMILPGGHFIFLDSPEANIAIKEFL